MSKVIIDGVEYVPKGEKEEIKERPFPQMGDEYWTLLEGNKKHMDTFDGHFLDLARREIGNMFRTEKEAEQEALRRECMATRWVPEDGEEVFIHTPQCMLSGIRRHGEISSVEGVVGAFAVMVGLAAPNGKEAKARWDMYGEAWLDALDVTTKK